MNERTRTRRRRIRTLQGDALLTVAGLLAILLGAGPAGAQVRSPPLGLAPVLLQAPGSGKGTKKAKTDDVTDAVKKLKDALKKARKDAAKGHAGRLGCSGLDSVTAHVCNCLKEATHAHDLVECLCVISPKRKIECARDFQDLVVLWKLYRRATTVDAEHPRGKDPDCPGRCPLCCPRQRPTPPRRTAPPDAGADEPCEEVDCKELMAEFERVAQRIENLREAKAEIGERTEESSDLLDEINDGIARDRAVLEALCEQWNRCCKDVTEVPDSFRRVFAKWCVHGGR